MIIEQPAIYLRWLYPRALWRMDRHEKAVYLTFDDGPIPEATPFILDTLKEFDVHATFFMVGDNVRKYPELYQRILREGHQVGNHTHNHIGALNRTVHEYCYNVEHANAFIKSRFFRPPGSIITFHDSVKSIGKLKIALPECLRWLKEEGYQFKVFE